MSAQFPFLPVDQIGDPIQLTTGEDAFAGANAAWREQLGYGVEDLRTKRFIEIVHADDRDHWREVAGEVLSSGRTLTFDIRLLTAGGATVDFEGTSTRVGSGPDAKIATVFHDISEQRRVLALMAQSEERFRAVNLYAPVGIFETDPNGECTYVNECWCGMTGLTPVAALGDGWREGIHPDDRDLVYAEWSAAVAGNREFLLDYRYRNVVTGEVSWLTCRAVPMELFPDAPSGYLGIALDITARRNAELAREASEARYRDLFDSSLGIICLHDLEGRLLQVNPAAARSLGYERERLEGMSLFDIVPPRFHNQVAGYLVRVSQEGKGQGLMCVVTADGDERMWSYSNIVRRDGGEVSVLANAQDVTALKMAEERERALSLTDELTGLANRRGFLFLAEQQIRVVRSARIPQSLILFFGDMNGLKQINDTQGHEAGDAAIRDCARILKQSFREADIVARLGGDEFAVLAISASGDPAPVLERVHKAFEAHNDRCGTRLSISLGARPLDPAETASLDEVIADADRAMYESKRRSKAAVAS